MKTPARGKFPGRTRRTFHSGHILKGAAAALGVAFVFLATHLAVPVGRALKNVVSDSVPKVPTHIPLPKPEASFLDDLPMLPAHDLFGHPKSPGLPGGLAGGNPPLPSESESTFAARVRKLLPAHLRSFTAGHDEAQVAAMIDKWNADRIVAWLQYPAQNEPSSLAFSDYLRGPKIAQDEDFWSLYKGAIERNRLDEAWKQAVWKTNPHRRIKSTHLVDATPDAATFKTVYGREASATQKKQLESAKRLASIASNQRQTSRADFNREACLKRFSTAEPSDLLLVVGHSIGAGQEDERLLVLPGGGTLSFRELHDAARSRNANCLILSCYSPDLNLTTELALDEAMKLASFARSEMSKAKHHDWGVDIADLAGKLSRDLRISRYKKNAVQIAGGGVAVTGVVYHGQRKESK